MNVAVHTPALPPASSQLRTLVRVLEFSCPGGYASLEGRLRRVPGIGGIRPTPRDDAVQVMFDPIRTNLAELEFVAAAAGYRVES